MSKSTHLLTDALKKIMNALKPHQKPRSFLLFIGLSQQGKTALMRQSPLQYIHVTGEHPADIFYNDAGIILDLSHAWISNNNALLQHTLKEINRCHKSFRITGLLLAINLDDLCIQDPDALKATLQRHVNLVKRFGHAINHRVPLMIVLTHLDGVAGFSDFFQQDHRNELANPLGFSLEWTKLAHKLVNDYSQKFDQFIQTLEQQILSKIHPVRSNVKRTLIREFPLQLNHLRIPLQTLLQLIPNHQCETQALYFTSAEQGGISMDLLNKKIQHDYSLIVREELPQSTNYRPYFIEGTLQACLISTPNTIPQVTHLREWQNRLLSVFFGLSIAWVAHVYFHAQKTLHAIDAALSSSYDKKQHITATKVLQLDHAANLLEKLPNSVSHKKAIQDLKMTIRYDKNNTIAHDFIPALRAEIEEKLLSTTETPELRYQALKIYLMLDDKKNRDTTQVINWYRQQWREKSEKTTNNLRLLEQILRDDQLSIAIDKDLVQMVRNYLNALPIKYFYYSMVKSQLSSQTKSIAFDGFRLAASSIPIYFTKRGFNDVMVEIPAFAAHLEAEKWVLKRPKLEVLRANLEEAYCTDYVLWWKKFIEHSAMIHTESYHEALQLTETLSQADALPQFIHFIQEQTSPNFIDNNNLFNRSIANQFTELNLVSQFAINDLSNSMHELQPFLMTLNMVQDDGKTAFILSKSRFDDKGLSNPLTTLYAKSNQFPSPISTWTKQLADDIWFLLMNDTIHYINEQWKETVYLPFQQTIANRYPFDTSTNQDISIQDFNQFFAPQGTITRFLEVHLMPFLNTSSPQWTQKNVDNFMLPIAKSHLNELIRARVITAMFFPKNNKTSRIDFSLQKINLDPVVTRLKLSLGEKALNDTQASHSTVHFTWPQTDATLSLLSIEGKHYELNEHGPWALFKLLQKVNVFTDDDDTQKIEILFEINGNSGRYSLQTTNKINPFTPGILNGFALPKTIVKNE